PPPTSHQFVPSQRAILSALTPPMLEKTPPALTLPLGATAIASIEPSLVRPLPSGDHFVPSHFAIRLALTPPASENLPPAYTSPDNAVAIANTGRSKPFDETVPSADQLKPSHLAIRLAEAPPAEVKSPPT